MTKVISLHSFRGGTGKSNTIASLAVIMATLGKRVGVVDLDVQSPGLRVIFGLEETDIKHSLNDYLWEKCKIEETAHDMSASIGENISGKLFLSPSRLDPREITRILQNGYDPSLLNEGFHRLSERLALDVLLIDTHPGINEETLLATTISDVVLIVLRPDQQDYIGTRMSVEMTRRLNVEKVLMLVNKAAPSLDAAQLKKEVEDFYQPAVAAVIPHSEELMLLSSKAVFALRYPDHKITNLYKKTAEMLLT